MARGVRLFVFVLAAGCGDASSTSPTSGPSSEAPAESDAVPEARLPVEAGDAGAAVDVPVNEAELGEWLRAGRYASWAHESAIHPSKGPHGGDVRTYFNDVLVDARERKAGGLPRGAAAVKELIDEGRVGGWAVLVKTSSSSDDGDGFYWYETFGTEPGSSAIAGQGHSTCTGCHAAGTDYVLTPFPLR
jgi:hypothetical protein